MPALKGKAGARISPLLVRVLEQVDQAQRQSESGPIAQAVAELSRLFTKERIGLQREYLDDPEHAAAYLRYFLPVNLSKIQVLLDELPYETIVSKEGRGPAVLDLGSGQGTASLAVLDWLHQRAPKRAETPSIVAVDSSAIALRQAEDMWSLYSQEAGIAGASFKTCEGNLERLLNRSLSGPIAQGAPYDLIILANCLNELFTAAADPIASRAGLVASLMPLLTTHGTIMIVEPALRQTSRELHQVRDRLLQENRCTIYSPCLHEQDCPALINPDNWCHEERAWEAPVAIHAIDQEVGFIKDALKFSYLLMRTDGRTIVDRHPETFRVVSELRTLKGDTRAWLCNESGRTEAGRLDRAQSSANAAWDECDRGTIVRIEGMKRKEESRLRRIPSDATVNIIRPT